MKGTGNIKYVLTSSYTKDGLVSFIPDLVSGLRHIFILKGAAGTGKTTFIRMIGEFMTQKGYDVEYWVSAADALNPEGALFPQLETAIINGSLPGVIDPEYPGVTGHSIYLGEYLDASLVKDYGTAIITHVDEWIKQNLQAVAALNAAARIKSEIESATAGHVNLHRLNNMIDELFARATVPEPSERHFFASAITAAGYISYVKELSAGCRKRYILKGSPGSGQSMVIQKIANKARAQGHRIEYYHSGLEANGLVMIILPELNVAIIDAGRVPMVTRPWDTVIDLRDYLDACDGEEAWEKTSQMNRQYEELLCQAQMELEIGQLHIKALKRIYSSRMDFNRIQEKITEVEHSLLGDVGPAL